MLSLRSQSEPVRPVAADTPFFMPFWQSLDQRSPHRLVVVLALSMRPTMSRSSSTRLVRRPWTSPTRNTVCLSPPLATVRRMRAGSNMSTEISEATMPTVLPQPTTPAMRSSFRQFCSDTTKPSGARYCLISAVAHSVS